MFTLQWTESRVEVGVEKEAAREKYLQQACSSGVLPPARFHDIHFPEILRKYHKLGTKYLIYGPMRDILYVSKLLKFAILYKFVI